MNMHCRGRAIFAVMTLVCLVGANVASPDLFKAATEGAKLSQERVMQMEASLLSSPGDANIRAQLLGYYALRKAIDPRRRQLNMQWFVQNLPADPFTGSIYCQLDSKTDPTEYERQKNAWLNQRTKHQDDTAILANAANFFLSNDDSLAEDILQHCADLEPKDVKWMEKLAALYEQRALDTAATRAKSSAQALAERDKLFVVTPDVHRRFISFIEMPRDAFLSGDMLRAKQLGSQLLAMADTFHDDPNYGFAIHQANIAMGRVAVNLGDIETADNDLLAAGKVPVSNRLSTEGPDMGLAKELLARGESKAVHEYLDLCSHLWPNGSARLKSWKTIVDEGGTPDFGDQAKW